MGKRIWKLVGSVFIFGLLTVMVFSAAALAAGTENELYVMKDGVTYFLFKTSESPEKYVSSAESGVFFESDGDSASLMFGKDKIYNYVLLRNAQTDEEIILTANDVNYRMRQVMSASGAKYEAEGDPSTVFWSKGHYATLEIGGKLYAGYDVWMPFGCIWLPGEVIPTNVEWRVKSIDGVDVVGDSNVTLTFGADGRLHGNASVNNYNASWISEGERLVISMAVTTKMMGSEELMKQEDSYLKTLAGVVRFKPLREGIVLLTKNNGEIVLERSGK